MSVKIVTDNEILDMLDTWDKKTGAVPAGKYLAQESETYIAVDNSSGELFVEEFDDLQEAVKWLYGIEEEKEEKEENQPPNIIQKGALFASIADVFYKTLSTDVTPEEASKMLFIALDIALKNAGCDVEKVWKETKG